MAQPYRTVSVSGLPTDVEEDRLKDKIFIHFLRSRNGGGEIESVTIVKATTVSALITFEDSRVARRVVQNRRHLLEVDGRKYNLVASVQHGRLDPDKVVQSLSAMVDHHQLPGGEMALVNLCKSHPDIRMRYNAAVKFYTLQGNYSKVQNALAELLGNPDDPLSAESKDSGQPATDGCRSVQRERTPPAQESEDQAGNANKQSEKSGNVHAGRSSDDHSPGSQRAVTPGGSRLKNTDSALQPSATSEEDGLLVVDADMFQYLQEHCEKEFQEILSRYGVEVVHVTNQGLTSLYLQTGTGMGTEATDQECVKLASDAIRSFFQENETKICRSQLYKSVLFPRGGLHKAKESLSMKFPKLFFKEDDEYLYIIGSCRDVSEAKAFLLHYDEFWTNKEDVASVSSHGCGSSSHNNEQTAPLIKSTASADSVDNKIDRSHRSEADERSCEAAGRYRLAARFKDTGLATIGGGPTDFSLRGGRSPPGRQAHTGPVLGHDVLSGPARIPGDKASRVSSQNTGEDMFRSREALPSAACVKNKTSLTSHLFDTRPKGSASPLNAVQSHVPGRVSLPPAGTGSNLKRANSFSGTPQQKEQVTDQKSQDDAGKAGVRARTPSLGSQTEKDKQPNEEVTVSFMMWFHIKDAYRAVVDDLTAGVQLIERRPEGSSDVTLTMRGANSSEVASCRQGLQKLLDAVIADFSVQELPLLALGITDTEDETLKACCAEVRSRFVKMTIQIANNSLFLLGPKQLCFQVGASLREIFSVNSTPVHEQQDFQTSPTSKWDPSTCLPKNRDQSPHLHCDGDPQGMLESQTSGANGAGSSQAGTTNNESAFQEAELVNGSIRQPLARIDPVVKEKVGIGSATAMDRQSTDAFTKPSKTENSRGSAHVSGVGATQTVPDKERTRGSTQKDGAQQGPAEVCTPGDSGSGLKSRGCICICGETEKTMSRTKCGATMCSKCLDSVHTHCRVCHVTEPTPRGIGGTIKYSKLHISIPGHKKDSAIKITYVIPDGIQEDGHPSPGKPYKGGVFEAFLPDCEKTRRLLRRMEKAFRLGLTFTVVQKGFSCQVTWDKIPHKTSIHGGKPANGYPDSSYLTHLSEVLTSHGIEEPTEDSYQPEKNLS